MLVNAYTIDLTYPASYYALAVVNHYKGNSFGNLPSIVPTLITLTVQFDAADIPVTQQQKGLFIFFEGASFIDDPAHD